MRTVPRAPMLARLHAGVFSAGLLLLLAGWAVEVPPLLIAAGPCLAMSGVLIWVGSRITFAGPLGDALRLALGRTRIVTLHARAVLWLLLGVLVTLWGVRALRAAEEREPPWHEQPLATEPPAE